MQDVKVFVQGRDGLSKSYNPTPLDEQINTWLKQHPNHSIRSISNIVGTGYKEAYVVFDIRDETKTNNKNNKTKE